MNIEPSSQPLPPEFTPTENTNVQNQAPTWGLGAAFANWFLTIVFSLIFPLILLLIYGLLFNRQMLTDAMQGKQSATMIALTLVGTFIGQIFTLAFCWFIVTEFGKRDFLASLGWNWIPQFKWIHAVALSIGMMILGAALEQLLPHKETSLEKFLQFGMTVKVILALVATIGAPLTEEITYRGLLFSAIERKANRIAAFVIVTILFWGVHVAQYIESPATLVAVFLLSAVLTGVRLYTGQLLPCVVVHTIFNGIQGIAILVTDTKPKTEAIKPQPAIGILAELWNFIF